MAGLGELRNGERWGQTKAYAEAQGAGVQETSHDLRVWGWVYGHHMQRCKDDELGPDAFRIGRWARHGGAHL